MFSLIETFCNDILPFYVKLFQEREYANTLSTSQIYITMSTARVWQTSCMCERKCKESRGVQAMYNEGDLGYIVIKCTLSSRCMRLRSRNIVRQMRRRASPGSLVTNVYVGCQQSQIMLDATLPRFFSRYTFVYDLRANRSLSDRIR